MCRMLRINDSHDNELLYLVNGGLKRCYNKIFYSHSRLQTVTSSITGVEQFLSTRNRQKKKYQKVIVKRAKTKKCKEKKTEKNYYAHLIRNRV